LSLAGLHAALFVLFVFWLLVRVRNSAAVIIACAVQKVLCEKAEVACRGKGRAKKEEGVNAQQVTEEIAEIAARAEKHADASETLDALRAVQGEVFGRKSRLSEIKKSLGSAPGDVKPVLGKAIGAANKRLNSIFAHRKAELEEQAETEMLEAERVDFSLPGRRHQRGRRHPVTRVIDEFCEIFFGMGYTIAEGPEVETDFYNFGALNMPKNHPARSDYDTLYVDHGGAAVDHGVARESEVLLRTHTSPVQIRVMESLPPPLYILAPGRCFRQDTVDATHFPTFHQIEGLAVDRGLTFGDLAGTLEQFTRQFLGASAKIRLRPDFFPFTEPSAELATWWEGRWLELGGCGMVDPAVFEAVGLDPEEWQGFAFGIGVERFAMTRYGIDDIRHFYRNDLRFLEQFL